MTWKRDPMLSGGHTNFKKAVVLKELPTPWEYLDYFMEYKHVFISVYSV